MKTCAVTGINWGDEGKGRMVDLVAKDYDIVVRFQGGNNAGHTIVNGLGKFVLNLIPSGIFQPNTVNVLGNGMVVDLAHLSGEIDKLTEAGVNITPDNLLVSNRAVVVFPYHVAQDGLEEDRLGDAKYGSTRRGIAPAYGDKYTKKAILMGELLYPHILKKRIESIVEYKNLMISGVYNKAPYSADEMYEWAIGYAKKLAPFITDTGKYLLDAHAEGKSIMFESQLGALRDIEFGIYPFTSSSSPIAAYAPIGAGVPSLKVDRVLGVVKAYSSTVGEGPFVAEFFGKDAEDLREAGHEYGAATGRPRQVGPIDLVATRYGVTVQGATEVALTNLDVISYMENIPLCTEYELNGEKISDFPFPLLLNECKPVHTYMPGWKTDISHVRNFEDLPKAAQDYVLYVEKTIKTRITYVSVGPERDAIILR